MPTGPYLVSSIAPITGADAGFRVRGTPVAYPGFLIYEKWGGGGGGGGAIRFRSDTKSRGPVHFRSDIRKVGGGGGQFASGPIRKVGGGGHSASGPIPLFGTQIIYTCTYLRAT